MNEEQKRLWDVILGIFSPVITAAALIFSFFQFSYTENHRVEFEHNAKLWESRIASYQDIATKAGKVVAHAGGPNFDRYVSEFSEIYYGPSLLSEDRDVEEKMVWFKLEIRDFKNHRSGKNQLIFRAKALIESCRNSAKIASEQASKDLL